MKPPKTSIFKPIWTWCVGQICPNATSVLAFCLLCLPVSSLHAGQTGTLAGRITDAEAAEPLPGANVVLLGTGLGAITDPDGNFRLTGLPAGVYDLSISMVGYTPALRKDVTVAPGDTVHIEVRLVPTVIEMPALVISASKRPRNIVDTPTSVALIDAQDLQTHNSVSLKESLDYLPGVNMVSGQVNIRGASGFSRGVGSRVLLLIDGFPALSADNGEIKWDAIPMDQIARVEIIKGAGSALYGTGALGGIINVITRHPSPQPETKFRVLTGLYSNPIYPDWHWASGRRYFEGIDISHSRQVGRGGLVLGLGQKWTNGYRENDWYKRYSAFGKFRYEFASSATLTATLNWAFDDHGVFIQWKDRNEPLEVPLQSQNDKTVSRKLNLNLAFYRLFSPRMGYRIKTFVYRTDFDNQVEGRTSSEAYKFGQELQVDLQPSDPLSITSGVEWIADRTSSSDNLFGNHTGLNLAAYAQAELEATDRLTLSTGARYDRYRTDGRPAERRISPKFGLSYRPWEHTSLRSALGWGFRGPSIAEIYTNAVFSGVPIVPNPDLVAERSLSYEIGLDRRFATWLHLDLAAFWSRYKDLIEARPDAAGVISFRNVSKGRIAGLEASAQASWRHLGFEGNYTLLDATEDLPSGSAPLPYRPQHLAAGSLRTTFGKLILEGRLTYRSRIQRASGLFPEGTRDLISTYLVDLSAACALGAVDLTLKVHNALEYNYTTVERNLGPPRRLSLGISGTF